MDEIDVLRGELRQLAKSSYMVNEKMPSYGYERKWRLFVRFADETGQEYIGNDDERGQVTILKQAINDARRHTAPVA